MKRNNPLVKHPLMRKGGAHQKAKSNERFKAKREIKRLLDANKASSRCIGYCLS